MSRSVSALSALMPISLWSRTFFVKCSPTPKSFTERRAILKTIQSVTQNDVEVFKKLKDNSSFIVVTAKPESTKTAIHDSPYLRTILTENQLDSDKPKRATWGALYDVRSTITSPIKPIPTEKTSRSSAKNSDDSDIAQRTFTIQCFPANPDFNHEKYVKKHALNGPWPDNGGLETHISAHLRQTVPSGHMAPGLRDWETGRQMLLDTSSFADEGLYGASKTILNREKLKKNMGYVLERKRMKRQKDIPEIMAGLAAYAKKVQEAKDAQSDTTETDDSATHTSPEDSESQHGISKTQGTT